MAARSDATRGGDPGPANEHVRLGWRDSILPLTEPIRTAARWWWVRNMYRLAPATGERFDRARSVGLDRALGKLEAAGGAP